MDINDIKHLAVERIFLIPDASEGQLGYAWCDDPAPGIGMDASEAVEYVRKDVHEAIIAKQAKAAISGMDATKAVASSNMEHAKRLHAESSPDALESERAANALLTERIAQLEADCAAHKAAEETQIALRQKADEREAAMAAHVERCNKFLEDMHIMDTQWTIQESVVLKAASPATSLAKRDLINQAHGIADFAFTWDWKRAPNQEDMRQTASSLYQQAKALK